MEHFFPVEQTAGLVFINICMLLLMYALMKRTLYPPYRVSVSNKRFVIVLMFSFALFSFWGADWFHYYEVFDVLKAGGRTTLEGSYAWIAQNLSPNYLVFRLVVWGSSLCLLLHMFKRLSIPTHLAIFFFSTISIIWFSYARVSLAMVLVYYGITILFKPYKNKVISYVLAIISICSAFFFHKSAGFAIIVALLTLFTPKFRKSTFLIILLCYPILLYMVKFYIADFLLLDMSGDESEFVVGMEAGQRYLNQEIIDNGPGIKIQRILERFPHFLLVFISYQFIKERFYENAPNDIKAFIRLHFFIVLLSSLFMFDFGVNTEILYGRFIRFAVIPFCVVLTYFYHIRFKFKYIDIIYKMAFAGTIYALLYSMYCAYAR